MKLEFTIAGASFRDDGVAVVASVARGAKIELRPEPDNKFDRNAVMVWVRNHNYGRRASKDYHLGYVPQKWSGTVTAVLKSNKHCYWVSKATNEWGLVELNWVDASLDPL